LLIHSASFSDEQQIALWLKTANELGQAKTN